VLFARTWPNALAAVRDRLRDLAPVVKGHDCVRTDAGRLEIDGVHPVGP
jgi:hypothetical protein